MLILSPSYGCFTPKGQHQVEGHDSAGNVETAKCLEVALIDHDGNEVDKLLPILNWNLPKTSSSRESRASKAEVGANTSSEAHQATTPRTLDNSQGYLPPQFYAHAAGGVHGGAHGGPTAEAFGDFSTGIAGGYANRAMLYGQEGGQSSNM
ncbi:hypothetical protein RUND412_005118 [Rhizina undulata]